MPWGPGGCAKHFDFWPPSLLGSCRVLKVNARLTTVTPLTYSASPQGPCACRLQKLGRLTRSFDVGKQLQTVITFSHERAFRGRCLHILGIIFEAPPRQDRPATWGHLGAILGPSWGHLGPSWGHLGLSWVILGPSWSDQRVEKSFTQEICARNLRNLDHES